MQEKVACRTLEGVGDSWICNSPLSCKIITANAVNRLVTEATVHFCPLKSFCFSYRMLWRQSPRTAATTHTAIYILLELSGLSRPNDGPIRCLAYRMSLIIAALPLNHKSRFLQPLISFPLFLSLTVYNHFHFINDLPNAFVVCIDNIIAFIWFQMQPEERAFICISTLFMAFTQGFL